MISVISLLLSISICPLCYQSALDYLNFLQLADREIYLRKVSKAFFERTKSKYDAWLHYPQAFRSNKAKSRDPLNHVILVVDALREGV